MLYVRLPENFVLRSISLDELERTAGDQRDSMTEQLPSKDEIEKLHPGRSVKLAEYIKHKKQRMKGYTMSVY